MSFPNITRCGLALLLVAMVYCMLPVSNADAQVFACSGAAGERQVGMSQGGMGVASIPLCVQDRAAPPPVVDNNYAAIAWHRDASDVWMDGNYLGSGGAVRGALDACNRAMGGGCESAGEWSNSTMAVIRNRNGIFFVGWMGEGGHDRQRVLAECSANQVLPCEVFKTFNSRRDHYFPGPEARITHAVAAWVEGQEGYNRKITAESSGGFIQTGTSDGERDFSTVEMTPARARQAALRLCANSNGANCQAQSVYDSRRPGTFVHSFATGLAD